MRGLIVKVYTDPANPEGSTLEMLNGLRDGRFGPFYADQPVHVPGASTVGH